jgi:hypothetical protein
VILEAPSKSAVLTTQIALLSYLKYGVGTLSMNHCLDLIPRRAESQTIGRLAGEQALISQFLNLSGLRAIIARQSRPIAPLHPEAKAFRFAWGNCKHPICVVV